VRAVTRNSSEKRGGKGHSEQAFEVRASFMWMAGRGLRKFNSEGESRVSKLGQIRLVLCKEKGGEAFRLIPRASDSSNCKV